METNKIRFFAICLLALVVPLRFAQARSQRTIDVTDYGVRPDGSDATSGVRAALKVLREGNAAKLVFPPGRYDFWPDRAEERYVFISNNDSGLKRIAFPLVGVAGVEIDGGGATFIFHGPMVPFLG